MTAPNITVPISADYTTAQQQGKAFLAKVQDDFKFAMGAIKEAETEGIIRPLQAAQREADALKVKNQQILDELRRFGDQAGSGTRGGAAYYTLLANGLARIKPAAQEAEAAVDAVAGASEDLGRRYGTSAVRVAGAAEMIARSGEVSGRGAKSLIAAAADAAFAFGPEGALVGAVGIATLAIVEMFRRTNEETKKLQEETKKRLDDLQNRGDVSGLTARAKTLYDGTASNNFQDGIVGLRAQIATEQQRLDDAIKQRNVFVYNAAKKRLDELKAQLAPLDTEFADVERRLLAPGPSATRERDPITSTAGRTNPQRDARLAEAQRRAREAFDSATAALTPGKSDDLDAQIARLVDAAQKAGLAQLEIDRRVTALRQAAAEHLAQLRQEFADKIGAQLATTTDAILTPARLALQAFHRELAQAARTGAFVTPGVVADPTTILDASKISALGSQRSALADAADQAKALKDQLDAIATSLSSGGGAIQAMGKLDTLLDQARHDVDATKAGTEQHAAAVERLKSVQQAVATLQSKTATETERAAAAAKLVESGTQRVAGDIAAAASAAAGLATAFLGANSEITKALVGVAGVAGGIEKISAAATKAGGLGKLLSTGAGVASIIPEVGGIIAGGGAIVSALSGLFHQGPSPEELAAQRAEVQALQQTISALHELSTKIGALDTANTSAVAQQAGIVAKSLVQSAVMDPKLTGTSLGANLIAQLGDVGLSFDDFKKAAATLGVTLTDAWHVTVEDLNAIAAAGDLVGNQTRELEASWTILGTSAKDQLQQFLAACEQIPVTLTNTTGGLAEAIAQLDLTSQAGRDAAATLVRNAYVAGTITAAVAEQFLKLLTGLADTGTAATQAASAIEVLDGTLSDIALVAGLAGHSMEDLYRSIDAATRAFPAFGDQIRDLFKGLDLSTTDGQSEFRTRVAAYAESLAKDGLTPDERGVLQWLGGLLGWVGDLGPVAASTATSVDGLTTATQALGATAQSVIQQILASASQAATDARRLGKDQTGQSQAEAESFESKIPGIGAVDVKDASSVARTLAVLRTVYGGLTADQTDLKDLFGGAIDFFSQFETKAPGASRAGGAGASTSTQIGTSASQLTEQTGVQIGAVLEGMYATERDQLTALTGIHATLAALTALPSPVVPTLPSWMLAGGGGTVVDRSVHIFIASLEVPFAAAGDPQGVGAGIGAGIQSTLTPDAIDASLGGSWRYGNLVAGDRTVRGKV